MEAPKFIKGDNVKNHGICCLFYGDSSSGKTYTAMTFPGPVYFLDTERRAENTWQDHFKDKEINIPEDIVATNTIPGMSTDALDVHKTIEDSVRFIIWYCNEVKMGKIKEGTIVIDSATDIWTFIQEWMVLELAKYTNKDGSKKADVMTLRLSNQTDWRMANKRHYEIIGILRTLLPKGINVVITAREQQPPEYVVQTGESTLKDKIRGHKDLPFMADYIFNMKKMTKNGNTIYVSKVEKAGTSPVKSEFITNLTYDKIRELKAKKPSA